MKHTTYFFIKVLHRHTFIFTIFCSTLAFFIVSQQQLLIAAPQDEQATDTLSTQSPNMSIKIDLSDDLGEREQQLFSDIQSNQDALLSKNSDTSDAYIQSYGTRYKETILVLYPATRNVLYMAYPDIPNSPSVTAYVDNFERTFRKEAATTNQEYYDFVRERGYPGALSIRHTLLFEVPFYSDELRIVNFYNTMSTMVNNGRNTITVLLFLQDGTELEQKDIFINYDEALAFIAETMIANLMQTHSTEEISILSDKKWIQEGAAPTPENYNNNLSFTQNADLVVFYNKYQVAAGANGIIERSIPYSTIEPFLSDTMKQLLKK